MNTLGIDLGTSELKALVMGADGAVLAHGTCAADVAPPHPAGPSRTRDGLVAGHDRRAARN